jgi:hypothetical protein
MNEFKKKVVEDITIPGMIVKGSVRPSNKMKVRLQVFNIAPGDDSSVALQFEALINRDDIEVVNIHNFPYQNTYNIAVLYKEPRTN